MYQCTVLPVVYALLHNTRALSSTCARSLLTTNLQFTVHVNVSLEVGGIRFPELLPPRVFELKLNVTALYNNSAISAEVECGPSSWTVIVKVSRSEYFPLTITCKLLLGDAILEDTVSYTA